VKILHAAETIKGGVATVISTISNPPNDNSDKYELLYLVPEDQKGELGNIDARTINTFHRSGRNLLSLFNFLAQLLKIILKEKPDVVHLHSTFAGVLGRMACLALKPWVKAKVIYCPHAFSFLMESSPLKQKLYSILERTLQHVTDEIICVSKYEINTAESFGINRKKMKLIYNGVHPKNIVPTINPDTPIKLLFVGRLDFQKGFDVLIKAYQLANRNDISLTAVGSAVNESAQELPQIDSIQYLSWVPASQVHEIYKSADILVVPSRWEGFAMVPLEGMSMGLPVISSDCTSLPEVVSDNVTGYTFPSGDHLALAKIISSLEKAKIHQLGKNAQQLVNEKFNASKMIEQTFESYATH
jgi:glycosyltransferase involved in cell wall biosynthesis